MKYLILSLLVAQAFAIFTLNPSTGQGFDNNEVSVEVVTSGDCSNAGFTVDELKSMVKEAGEDLWNRVPSSSLELKLGSDRSDDISSLAVTDMLGLASANTIIAGCNENFSSTGTLGVGSMTCSGGTCYGALLLNAASGSALADFDRGERVAVVAHELGHAFGLGHSSEKESLMYYSVSGKHQEWLGQDDIDGVTYLYPQEGELSCLLGPILSVGQVRPPKKGGGKGSGLASLLLGLAIIGLLFGLGTRFSHQAS